MATAHLSVKVGKAGKGVPHAEYISRVGKYEKKLDGNEQLEATESGNMPLWAQDNPLLFWRAADLYERKNGTVYREHEIALPRELSPEHRAELVRDWVEQELGDRHAYTWAIHNKTALDGGEQPHVHLMFSERIEHAYERDKGILDMRGGDIEASKRIWLLARAANIETSQQFDDFVTNKQIGMAVEAARKKARLEAEAAGKGIAPEIAQAFQQRAERIAQEQETARQESEAAKREQQQPHQSKTVTAYKPPEQVKIKQNENQQPTQTQKKGRGIKH